MKKEACNLVLFFIIGLSPLLLAASCKNSSKPVSGDESGVPAAKEETAPKKEAVAKEEKEKPTDKVEEPMGEKYELTREEKKWLMQLAKDAVKAAADGKKFDPPDPPTETLKQNGAAFVTLRKQGKLRGCIGHIIAQVPLYECIASVARSAALEDHRFSPVTASEYASLHFEISVLTPPEEVKDPEGIVVGTDGVIISYGGFQQGVFLPQVPTEQGWDRTQYLDNLCYKAGVMHKGCWKEPKAVLKKFQALVWEEEDVE